MSTEDQDNVGDEKPHFAHNFSLMQQLIDEMDKSRQCVKFSSDQYESDRPHYLDQEHFETLYDDAWKSEESDVPSLQELPIDYLDGGNEESGCEDAVNSAIAEVSKDFLSGLRVTSVLKYEESDESHVSSDADFKLITGMASYARYPETAAGLSDNDWNPYGTESDTNMSPCIPSHDGSGPKLSDSRISSMISFNPPLHSTDFNVNTPSTVMYSIPDAVGQMSKIQGQKERETAVFLEPDIMADFSSVSQMSEQTVSSYNTFRNSVTALDLNKTLKGSQLGTENSANPSTDSPQNEVISLKESLSDQEQKRMIGLASSSASSGLRDSERQRSIKGLNSMGSEYVVTEQAMLKHIPDDTKNGRAIKEATHHISHKEKVNDSGDRQFLNEDYLGQRVKKVLVLSNHSEINTKRNIHGNSSVDYNMLHRDLQEIQDSLYQTLGPGKNEKTKKKTSSSSDSDDIIPSTTTTPDKKINKMAWDFAADLGYQQPGGLMGDISLETLTTTSQRPSEGKRLYNSDGDETRTSGSSDKLEDHAAADQALAEMSEILHPSTVLFNPVHDVDQMLSNFKNQRRQIENRYQQLSNQGLAEKISRILTSQNPEAQASGILSEVNALEKELKAKSASGLHKRDFNFSSISVDIEESYQSLAVQDDVRKRLDLSGLSCMEMSRLTEKSLPISNGFSAFNDMAKFLSSQMAKASERSFNHSMEMRISPQIIQCYPLYGDTKNKNTESKDDIKEHHVSSTSAATQQTKLKASDMEPDRPTSTSSPNEVYAEHSNNSVPLHDDSDTSSGRSQEKYRPYRPAGSREVYYTESDGGSVADSVTTVESTHLGSDDARGPVLPSSALGSRKDPPNVVGIYSNRKHLATVQEREALPPIQEKSGTDEMEINSSPKKDLPKEQSGRKGYSVSSSYASNKETTGRKQNIDNSSSQADEQGCFDGRPSKEKKESMAGSALPEVSSSKINDPPAHSVANRREEKENYRQEIQLDQGKPDVSDNLRVWNNGKHDFSHRDYQSQCFEVDDFDSNFRKADARKSLDHFNQQTDAFLLPVYHRASKHDRGQVNEPESFTNQIAYDGHSSKSQLSQKYRYSQGNFSQNKGSYSTEDLVGVPELPTLGYHSSIEIPYRSRFSSSENPYSPKIHDLQSQHQQGHIAEISSVIPRSYSDEDLHTSVKDTRLSPAFHRALSPDLRQAIKSRSPLLSKYIERSLAHPPTNQQRQVRDGNLARSLSPPPTFLARDRGHLPREYMENLVSTRKSPQSHANQGLPHAWSPTLQVRPLSPSLQAINLFGRVTQSASPSGRRAPVGVDRTGVIENLDLSNRKALSSSKRQVELTLENMSSDSDDTELDKEPVSKRAQLLTQALTHEQEIDAWPDINTLWEQFKAVNESNDSSMNSSRMEAITDLLRNPSRHLIFQYLKEREEYRIERQERVEAEKERRLKEQQQQLSSACHSSSEDDLNGSYAEFLAHKEEERLKRRLAKKKKGKAVDSIQQKNAGEATKNENNIPDSLFSIPEDASFEQSPVKSGPLTKVQKPNVSRQPHVIDPNMIKLRERIAKQKNKIDKNTLKELRRMDKLKKLQHLLSAKKQGEINDQTLEQQLEEISSTSTPGSDNSQDGQDRNDSLQNTTPLSDDSTTAKDSSAEMHAWKADKERLIQKMNAKTIKGTHFAYRPTSLESKLRKSEEDRSYIHLLQLVKEGFLTPEEAYRRSVKRDNGRDDLSSFEESFKSSSDDLNRNYNSRLHKLYSPYSRNIKPHYVPKLKHPPSIYDLEAAKFPSVKQTHVPGQELRSRSSWTSHNNSQGLSSYFRSGYIHAKFKASSKSKSPSAREWPKSKSPCAQERPVISIPTALTSSQQHSHVSCHKSPSESVAYRTFSPPRHDKRTSPTKWAVSRSELKFSPERGHSSAIHRPQSASPARTGSRAGSRQGQTGKQTQHTLSSHPRKMHRSENEPPQRRASPKSGGVAWQIPMDFPPTRWKESKSHILQKLPLQEKKSNFQQSKKSASQLTSVFNEGMEPLQGWEQRKVQDIWHKSDRPQGLSQELWQHIICNDALASKTNHWDVDPERDRVQYVLNKPTGDSGTDEDKVKNSEEKPISKMSLQEAFIARKQSFISKSRERQKRLALSRENRNLQEVLRLEREAIFMDQERITQLNYNAHPCSNNLYQPKKRFFSKQEMKDLTMKRYKTLPEVLQKRESDKRSAEYNLNRFRAQVFNKKVQREVLRKGSMRRR